MCQLVLTTKAPFLGAGVEDQSRDDLRIVGSKQARSRLKVSACTKLPVVPEAEYHSRQVCL